MNARFVKPSLGALALAAALGSAYTLGQQHGFPSANATTAPTPLNVAASPVNSNLPDMSAIIANAGPAVVNISVSGTRKVNDTEESFPGLDPNDPFFEFFRQFRSPRSGGSAPMRGQGSGFIVSPDGTVLTNAHVVEGADEVSVKLTDKREFRAKVLGLDKASDVAILKIEARDLPVVRIGQAANARVGEWVVAIGSPFGFENSASAGIISAKSRTLPDGSYVPFIQTDVAVNPGNSGGPLFNMRGEVIGINSQIYSRSGGYQGLSFAIPIELAMNVERQIVANGKVQRGRIGVSVQEVNQALADAFGLKSLDGALINGVEKDGPAAKAGLESGDVILAINGKPITSVSELPAAVAAMAPGESAQLKVWHKGASREIEIKIASFNDNKALKLSQNEAPQGRLGVAVRPLSAQEQRELGSPGILVQEAQGAAAKAGIEAGDVILSVNGERVSSVEQLRSLLAKSGKRAAVLIARGDAKIFVPVDLG